MAIGLNLFVRVARGSRADFTGAVFGSLLVPYGLLCLLVGLGAHVVLLALFGHAYVGSVLLLRWLLPGTYALGLLAILSYYYAGIGYPTASILVWLGGLVANIALNVVLIPAFGTVVASVTSSGCYLGILAGQMFVFVRTGGTMCQLRPRAPIALTNLRGMLVLPAKWKP
jgi:O-antigen/teichoic acid export membrane protein